MFASALAVEVIGRERDTARLEGEIAQVCGVLNATTGRLVELIAEVLASGSWTGAGIRSPQQWVAWQCGLSMSRARGLVAMATRLAELPVAAAAFTGGELSEDQVRVLCRHTPVHNDAEVTDLARHATVTQLSRTLRSHQLHPEPVGDPADEPADGQPVEEIRRVSFGTDDNSWWMTLTAPLDEGALIEGALTNARQHLFHDRDRGRTDGRGDPGDVAWMDALLHLVDQAQAGADITRPRPDRYLALLHLATHSDGNPVGSSPPAAHLHGGPALPDSIRRYLTCDGNIRAVQDIDGVPVSVGRTQRTIPDRTRWTIENRDRGCRVPGCDQHRWLHIHHITHWENGGPTDTDNLLALCPAHHRLHHNGQLGIVGDPTRPNGITFTDHNGRELRAHAPPTPPRQPPDQAAAQLGIPPGRYIHATGEHLQQRWVSFSESPSPN